MLGQSIRTVLRWVGFLVGGGILIYQIIISIIVIRQVDLTFSPIFFIGAIIASLGAIGMQMITWKKILKSLDIELTFRQVLDSYLPSFLPRYIPGTFWGYISRSEWLYQKFKISYQLSSLGSLLEIQISILSNLLVAGFSFALFNNRLPFMPSVILLILANYGVLYYLVRFRGESALRLGFLGSFRIRKINLGHWFISVLLFSATWILYGFGLGFVVNGLITPAPIINLNDWLNITGIYSLAWLFGFMVIIAPAGIGFREYALSFLLVFAFGYDPQRAGLIGILMRLLTLLSEFIWLLFVWGYKKIHSSD